MISKFYKLLDKSWSANDVQKYIDPHIKCYRSYSLNTLMRLGGASGGVVSTLLSHAMSSKTIDGALVCRSEIQGKTCRAFPVIARSEEELQASQGSKYVQTHYFPEATRLINSFSGPLAVVGLPCQIAALNQKMLRQPELRERVALTIALFCGHNSMPHLINTFLEKVERTNGSAVKDLRFRIGHWRGRMLFRLEDGRIVDKSFKEFSLYQNLFFFAQKSCLHCKDHFGYEADLCVGDIWSYKYKFEKIKHSSLIAKTQTGVQLVQEASTGGALHCKQISAEEVLGGQSRSAPFHYNVTARHKAGKLLKVNIPDTTREPVSWHEYLAACIAVFNWKLSHKHPHLVFLVPRKLLTVYLYIFKALESM